MSESFYYYLHENGDLIGKPPNVIEADGPWVYFDSPFVRKWWHLDLRERGQAWDFLCDAIALGANVERVRDLAQKWRCSVDDLHHYLEWKPREERAAQRPKLARLLNEVWELDLDIYLEMLGHSGDPATAATVCRQRSKAEQAQGLPTTGERS